MMKIGRRYIGPSHPVYFIAEMSANHGQSFDQAVRIIEAAKASGADAVKLQTYTPDSLTICSDKPWFQIKGTQWSGRTLYELYSEAYTPWDWQPKLKEYADSIGIELFSTPFDAAAVDFLNDMGVAVHKVASFELVDIPLLKKIGASGKPVIMSTGLASLAEIDEAVSVLRSSGCDDLVLLKCTSSYPAPPTSMNLRTIPNLSETFGVPVGLSDHSLGDAAAIASVVLGACVIEKHFTLTRSDNGPDSSFSMEPEEFLRMVNSVRTIEQALGKVNYGLTSSEEESRRFRRSLFVVKDVKMGELFTEENVRSIRPCDGLHTRHLESVLGRAASVDIERGTPLHWELIR
jgi:N-acetylneuraminate synthase